MNRWLGLLAVIALGGCNTQGMVYCFVTQCDPVNRLPSQQYACEWNEYVCNGACISKKKTCPGPGTTANLKPYKLVGGKCLESDPANCCPKDQFHCGEICIPLGESCKVPTEYTPEELEYYRNKYSATPPQTGPAPVP